VNITVFLGAPGSGKGTQAKRLSQGHGFRHFSTGDMLRASIQSGDDVGLRAKGFIDRGELVPDDVMIALIEKALTTLPAGAKVILDGFPRTVPQAEALDRSPKTSVKSALFFNVPHTTLISRLTGRRICEKCGEPFHVEYLAPKVPGVCDRCGGKLIQRSDDSENVVRRRLEVFASQNGALLDYYRSKNRLHEFQADMQVDRIQQHLLQLLQ
jgi:adenylate kinase